MKITDLTKVATGNPTPCSIALVELIRANDAIYGDDGLASLKRDLTDAEDRRWNQLEERVSALEAQIRREVAEKLGVDYAILWQAVTG